MGPTLKEATVGSFCLPRDDKFNALASSTSKNRSDAPVSIRNGPASRAQIRALVKKRPLFTVVVNSASALSWITTFARPRVEHPVNNKVKEHRNASLNMTRRVTIIVTAFLSPPNY
jgi:hypothetical protein